MFPERSPLNELTDPRFRAKHPRLHAKLVELRARGYFGKVPVAEPGKNAR